MQQQDSPLSIAASIAGLLTFAVAVFGFIYIRIINLRNGKKEMREAGLAVLYIAKEMRLVQTQFENRPEFEHIQETLSEILQTGQEIIDQFAPVKHPFGLLGLGNSWPLFSLGLWMATGVTPSLFQWYKVRDNVLENTRKMDMYRNRLIFYQIALMNQQIIAQQTSMDQLLEKSRLLQSTLQEMVNRDMVKVES